MSAGDESEATFADVFNGLSMGGRKPRKRAADTPHRRQEPAPAPAETSREEVLLDLPGEANAASVRAYAWTGGRTSSNCQLEIETLVSATARAEEMINTMRAEHQAVTRLCRQSRSVAEIGALLSLPLGVVRVLLDDMAGLGLVDVHGNTSVSVDGTPDMDLLQRVLRGLTNLRT
jgi:hypothetical protein